MELFITWSGEYSKELGNQFNEWLPPVLQSVHPYFSPDDIHKGAKWFTEVSKQLDKTNFGIAMMTNSNLQSPWIMFEAGAVAKRLGTGKFCPILFGVKPIDLQGPLTEFQAAPFEKTEIKRLIISMNDSCDEKINLKIIDKTFEAFWPDLEKRIIETQKKYEKLTAKKERTPNDMLEEILIRVRAIGISGIGTGLGEISSRVLNDLNIIYNASVDAYNRKDMFSLGSLLEQLYGPISFIGEKTSFNFDKPQVNRDFELGQEIKKEST